MHDKATYFGGLGLKQRTQGILGLFTAQAVLGTLGVCVIESGVDSVSVVFYRCAIGGVLLALYCYWRGDLWNIAQLPIKAVALALLSGALMVANWVLFFEGIQRTSISIATIAFHVQPFFVLLLGAALYRERLRPVTFLWLFAAFVGLTLATGIAFDGDGMSHSMMVGLACTLAAALFYALVTLIAKGLTVMKSHQLTFIQCAFGSALLSVILPMSPTDVAVSQWAWLFVIGAIHTGGVYMLLYNALPKLSTSIIAVLLFVYPASAVVVDALVYRTTISLLQAVGLGLIIISSLGVTLRWGAGNQFNKTDSKIIEVD